MPTLNPLQPQAGSDRLLQRAARPGNGDAAEGRGTDRAWERAWVGAGLLVRAQRPRMGVAMGAHLRLDIVGVRA